MLIHTCTLFLQPEIREVACAKEAHSPLARAVHLPEGPGVLEGSWVVIRVPLRVPLQGSTVEGLHKGIGFGVYLEVHG